MHTLFRTLLNSVDWPYMSVLIFRTSPSVRMAFLITLGLPGVDLPPAPIELGV
jgi:hypothetical protein